MHNFVFHNPTKVIFARNAATQVGTETALLGKRVLLLSGEQSAERSGLLPDVRKHLQTADTDIVELPGVLPNPTVEFARDAIKLAQRERIEVILAVGGGSVIDTAKAVAAGTLVNHDVWKFFTGKKSVKQVLPVIALSTLAASGSEVNSGMVLTNEDQGYKFGFAHRLLYPKTALMDPELTFSVSPAQTAYGAVDALAHLLEVYMTHSLPFAPLQQNYIEGLARTIVQCCDIALREPANYSARSALMWAAGLALNGIAAAGLGKVGFPMHLIEHSLSALYKVPHGAGLAAVIPGWLTYHQNVLPERISRFIGTALSLPSPDDMNVQAAIAALKDWFSSIKVPVKLQDLDISPVSIPTLASNAEPLARIWRMREYDAQKIENILNRCC